MKQIVVFPRGQLSADDRRTFSELGADIIIVEADDPNKVVTLLPMPPVPAEELLAIALESLGTAGSGDHQEFIRKMAQAIRKRLPISAERTPDAQIRP